MKKLCVSLTFLALAGSVPAWAADPPAPPGGGPLSRGLGQAVSGWTHDGIRGTELANRIHDELRRDLQDFRSDRAAPGLAREPRLGGGDSPTRPRVAESPRGDLQRDIAEFRPVRENLTGPRPTPELDPLRQRIDDLRRNFDRRPVDPFVPNDGELRRFREREDDDDERDGRRRRHDHDRDHDHDRWHHDRDHHHGHGWHHGHDRDWHHRRGHDGDHDWTHHDWRRDRDHRDWHHDRDHTHHDWHHADARSHRDWHRSNDGLSGREWERSHRDWHRDSHRSHDDVHRDSHRAHHDWHHDRDGHHGHHGHDGRTRGDAAGRQTFNREPAPRTNVTSSSLSKERPATTVKQPVKSKPTPKNSPKNSGGGKGKGKGK